MLAIPYTLASVTGPTAYFYGWQVLEYVRYLADAYLKQFPWQVQMSLIIITISSLSIFILYALFFQRIIRRSSRNRALQKCRERYEEAFRTILLTKEKMPQEEMEYVAGADEAELRMTNGDVFTQLLVSLRLEMADDVYIPNMQRLCNITGVKNFLEAKLVKNRDVEQTLQVLMTLPIRVSEGALAPYTDNKNLRIRELARSYFGFCSKTEPFHFVTEDVNKSFNLWYPPIFHRLCSWHRAKGHPIPQLLALARRSDNDARKALFISEIPYWGTKDEKTGICQFLTSSSPKCRSAAIQALALIGDPASEAELVKNYSIQFPTAKRETLLAIAKINTGRQTEFFRQAYLNSTSHSTRAVALSCLFNYGESGRQVFYELRRAGLDDSRFFEQIISAEEMYGEGI
ncbi:MAG: HEAT repeat domain-containing protein [Paludibacteraceae bacterium]|nr:HEAT repeat domain-containing protein [Paludibacteraceae bacterium]